MKWVLLKKWTAMACVGMLLVCSALTWTVKYVQAESVQNDDNASDSPWYGDVDGNGLVEAKDALLVLRHVVQLETLQGEQEERADVDKNGTVNGQDALYILQYVVKLIDSFDKVQSAPTETPALTPTPEPTETPAASPTPEPTETPAVSPTPVPTDPAVFAINYIPEEYKNKPAEEQGTVIKISYKTDAGEKYVRAYLPYGYDQDDTETKYNIFYLMHGAGNTVDTIFDGAAANFSFKRVLDHMIENGEIDPLIVVTPTFLSATGEGDLDKKSIENFPEEFVNDVIPAVEGQLHTYAESTDKAGIEASRDHRAYGGFSMGSASTWYIFTDCLEYVRYYMPMSGDCWAYAIFGGSEYAEQTIEYLIDSVNSRENYTKDDFFIYAMTGQADFAYEPMESQMRAASLHPEMFTFSDDQTKGNIYFNVSKIGQHNLNYCYQYVYTALPRFWPKQ